MRMRALALLKSAYGVPLIVGLALSFQGCGGGLFPLTGPTDTLGPHEGSWAGQMTFSDDHTTTGASTTVKQSSGSTLHFTNLVLSGGASVSAGVVYGLGSATLTGEDFNGTSSYSTTRCGIRPVAYQGRFSGNRMSLKVTFPFMDVPGVACGGYDLEGELSKCTIALLCPS